MFHRGFQTLVNNTEKHSAYGIVLSSVFSCLETPMKHSHFFLKYYYQQQISGKNQLTSLTSTCMDQYQHLIYAI